MNPTRNDLPAKTRSAAIALLNARLADLLDLRSQLKQAHWNVKGPAFIAVHELMDKLAGEVNDWADMVAERVMQLGGAAKGTVRMAAAGSSLPEYPDKVVGQRRTLQTVADRIAAVAKPMRAAIDTADDLPDVVTSDLLTEVTRGLDVQVWFVESHLHAER